MSDNQDRGFFIQAFDVFFVMVLCFLTLLASMLLNGPVIVGSGATGKIDDLKGVTPESVTIIIVILVIYLIYLLKKSSTELRIMVNELYSDQNTVESAPTPDVPALSAKEESV